MKKEGMRNMHDVRSNWQFSNGNYSQIHLFISLVCVCVFAIFLFIGFDVINNIATHICVRVRRRCRSQGERAHIQCTEACATMWIANVVEDCFDIWLKCIRADNFFPFPLLFFLSYSLGVIVIVIVIDCWHYHFMLRTYNHHRPFDVMF